MRLPTVSITRVSSMDKKDLLEAMAGTESLGFFEGETAKFPLTAKGAAYVNGVLLPNLEDRAAIFAAGWDAREELSQRAAI